MARPTQPVLAAVLGPGTRYEGDMTFEGRVRIDGHYVGGLFTRAGPGPGGGR